VKTILIKNLSVKASGMVHGGCWVNFPTVGKLEASTVCWREFTKRLSSKQAVV